MHTCNVGPISVVIRILLIGLTPVSPQRIPTTSTSLFVVGNEDRGTAVTTLHLALPLDRHLAKHRNQSVLFSAIAPFFLPLRHVLAGVVDFAAVIFRNSAAVSSGLGAHASDALALQLFSLCSIATMLNVSVPSH